MKKHPWKSNNIFKHVAAVELVDNKLERRKQWGRERRDKNLGKLPKEIKIKERN